ncbi:hypothetical protein ABZ840_17015 [Streptomyces sp. NPDC047117]|uniref:hypothetical protein n=1 Tax=Streptomyces sp. NPDC047117 TaxID=3155379 RepID=UPI0033FB89AD
MTSRTPRDSRLRLVPRQPIAAARRAVSTRTTRPAPRPPEGTPPPAELARMARGALAGAVRVARWAARERGEGTGARAAADGSLPDAAAEQAAAALELTPQQVRADWDRARLAGLIELHGGVARPGWRLRAWDRDDSAALRGWVALFDAWSLALPAPADVGPGAVAEVIEALPQVLSLLYLSAGPVEVADLLELLDQRIAELRTERCEVPYERAVRSEPSAEGPGATTGPVPVPASGQDAEPGGADGADASIAAAEDGTPAPAAEGGAAPDAGGQTTDRAHGRPAPGGPDGTADAGDGAGASSASLLDWALEALAAVGALVVPGGGTRTRGAADAAALLRGGEPAGERQARLTPLGSWAVWVKLEQICVAAQSPAGNIEQSAEAMLRGCARLTPGPARAEYRAWLAARSAGSAVEELLAVARGEDALLRGLAFEALRTVGAPAEPAVRAAASEAALRPYALLWLVEHEGGDPETAPDVLTREESTWLWVDTAAAVADHGESRLLVRHLDSAVQGSVPRLLEEVRAVGHPRTVQVLVALAAAHPDPALAKAVRRAAFQVHTGGA